MPWNTKPMAPSDDPWKIHAQHFPCCPHVTNWKTKIFFVKDILQRNPDKSPGHYVFTDFYNNKYCVSVMTYFVQN